MTLTPELYAAALYVGLLALVGVWISFRVGLLRGRLEIAMGDGGDPRMLRAMRGHANYAENVPVALVVVVMSAVLGAPLWVVHGLGAVLFVARVLHGMHFMASDAPGWQRFAGATGTIFVQAVGGLGLLGHALLQLF